VINLVIASGYLSSLIGNSRVSGYLERHHPEILTEFKVIVAAMCGGNRLRGIGRARFLGVRQHDQRRHLGLLEKPFIVSPALQFAHN
jgi:hypothetical protein